MDGKVFVQRVLGVPVTLCVFFGDLRTSRDCCVKQVGGLDKHVRYNDLLLILLAAECDLHAAQLLIEVLLDLTGKE